MSCPKCGSTGEVPLDRLNSRLTCKKCKTVFHMDLTGQIVLGEPGKGKKVEERELAFEPPDLAKMIQDIPKPVKLGAATLAVGVLLFVVVGRLVSSIGAPQDVNERGRFVAEQFADQRLERIEAVAVPETTGALTEWYEKARPLLNLEGPRNPGTPVRVLSVSLRESESTAVTLTSLMVTGTPAPTEAVSGPRDNLSMELYWVKQGSHWMLDGAATLNALEQQLVRESRRRPSR